MGKKIQITIIVLLLFIIGYILLGPPDEVGFPSGFVWKNLNPESNDLASNSLEDKGILISDTIRISRLDSRREIYFTGENVTVDAEISNPFEFKYDVYFYWVKGEKKYYGWGTKGNSSYVWSSWIVIDEPGEWKSLVIVEWEYKGQRYNTDSTEEILIIE